MQGVNFNKIYLNNLKMSSFISMWFRIKLKDYMLDYYC